MPSTSIHLAIDPEPKQKAKQVAEEMGVSLSEYARTAIIEKADRDHAELSRIERRISGLGQKDTRKLEDMEDRLLNRVESLSEAESRLLDAVQEELRTRSETVPT
jgi:antitoxin component of RelBE/YafQ-DinJ toxin-antitoxin module